MKIINIAFAVNDAYADYLGVTIYTLLKNRKGNHKFNFYILTSDLTGDSEMKLNRLHAIYKNFEINVIKPSKEKISPILQMPLTINHITIETYYRYLLADLLPEVKKILYLDVDLIALRDISDLWSVDVSGDWVAGSSESDNPKRFPGYIESIGLHPEKDTYINAGVLLMNLQKIREDRKAEELIRNTVNLGDSIKFQDQDVINITLKGGIKKIDKVFNYTDQDRIDDNKERRDIVIAHFNGPTKPWKKGYAGQPPHKFYSDQYIKYFYEYKSLLSDTSDTIEVTYALYEYKTDNIGDEIQSIAARRFLPRIDHFIDRDNIDQIKADKGHIKLIMNGWYSHKPENFPTQNANIEPLLISMYISDHVKDLFNNDHTKYFLKKYGPVGARNTDSKKYFDDIGVDSYFSGCLTLTIHKSPEIQKRDFILAIDVPSEVVEELKRTSKTPVLSMGAFITTENMNREERFALAEYYLYLYQSAKCVVTTRLHATLPCLALETPVLNLEKENFEPGRFAGLRELSHHMTIGEFLNDPHLYNINKPPKNPQGYLKIRKNLEKRASSFTGYINNKGFLTSSVDQLLNDVNLIQPVMSGLMSGYDLNYVEKVLSDSVNMPNNSIRTANEITKIKEERDMYHTLYTNIVESRSWRAIGKIRKLKELILSRRQ